MIWGVGKNSLRHTNLGTKVTKKNKSALFPPHFCCHTNHYRTSQDIYYTPVIKMTDSDLKECGQEKEKLDHEPSTF